MIIVSKHEKRGKNRLDYITKVIMRGKNTDATIGKFSNAKSEVQNIPKEESKSECSMKASDSENLNEDDRHQNPSYEEYVEITKNNF
jgi:hypothetical protein